jgi:ATP-dependent exoDNAse (exonuclease V) beta subunit
LETLDYASSVPLLEQINSSPEWADIPSSDRKRIQTQVLNAATTISKMLGNSPSSPLGGEDRGEGHSSSQNNVSRLTLNASPRVIRELPFAARFTHDNAQLIVDGKVDLLFFKDNCWHVVDYKFSDLPSAELKSRYATQLHIYRAALSHFPPVLHSTAQRDDGGSRTKWKLILLSINSQGHCTPIEIEDEPATDLSAQLIQSAKKLAKG